jgi:hypothetical protein
MLLFALAQIVPCESSRLCPTKQQVLEAVIERDNEAFGSAAADLSSLDQDMELVKTTNNPKISDIACVDGRYVGVSSRLPIYCEVPNFCCLRDRHPEADCTRQMEDRELQTHDTSAAIISNRMYGARR